jgi:hypothetical protein
MMRLVLASKSMEGIEEELLKSQEHKTGENTLKITEKEKMGCTLRDEIQS